MKGNKAVIIITGRKSSGKNEAAKMCFRRYGLTYAEGISPEKKDIYVLEPSEMERGGSFRGDDRRVITVCIVPSLDEKEARGIFYENELNIKDKKREYNNYIKLRNTADYIFSNSSPSDLAEISDALAFLVKHG